MSIQGFQSFDVKNILLNGNRIFFGQSRILIRLRFGVGAFG